MFYLGVKGNSYRDCKNRTLEPKLHVHTTGDSSLKGAKELYSISQLLTAANLQGLAPLEPAFLPDEEFTPLPDEFPKARMMADTIRSTILVRWAGSKEELLLAQVIFTWKSDLREEIAATFGSLVLTIPIVRKSF